MTSAALPAPTETVDLDAAAVADAATRLSMLQRLASLGMRLAEEICERAIDSPYHPEPRHEPGRAFAAVARTVRLTLVLQEKAEAQLIALRKGEALPPRSSAAPRARRASAPGSDAEARDDGEEADSADSSGESLHERESERFDELLAAPFDDCVASIRSGLGLAAGDAIPSEDESIEAAVANVLERASDAADPQDPSASEASAEMTPTPPPSPDSG